MPEQAVDAGTANRRTLWVVASVAVLVLVGMIALVVWALRGQDGGPSDAERRGLRSSWESAMAKASVEATYPGGPVNLTGVKAEGSHPFKASFTADEIEALLAVYRFEEDTSGSRISLEGADLVIDDEVVRLEGRIIVDGNAYSARIEGMARWSDDAVRVDRNDTRVVVEGFTLGGSRREMALKALETYVNAMIEAAPGLRVQNATIRDGRLEVEGSVPTRIVHPSDASDIGPASAASYQRRSDRRRSYQPSSRSSSQARFSPRRFIVAMPSASSATSPFSRPMAMFQ